MLGGVTRAMKGAFPAAEHTGSTAALPTRLAGARRPAHGGRLHAHLFRRIGDDPFSGATLYRCRCGVVRPGM